MAKENFKENEGKHNLSLTLLNVKYIKTIENVLVENIT